MQFQSISFLDITFGATFKLENGIIPILVTFDDRLKLLWTSSFIALNKDCRYG
ncbi:hypothetical protein PGT21_030124 [Puccinia graminis f. sp. tritici]|uniref:Uncharacterized protein n=1 Tax=Puccinia graminis f. sp. tritici TaxID=56615 RepID=A0A5B0LS90_PUCGR|nr:hypothetical protein PGT21_030124 [Puccinia graminis f. sp. tritici]KAA1081981.1 hypothetical protein PGTUg99_031392 [Puccinia graminis f. sp. tritici]